ncbi:uncharacterized protein PG986_009586 [Apiospora aurea]|uniref:Uncharacterized protein n=1 Tax=Apiospora aurea TaxID=335848 RepID=A0ABR1Q8C9_9PEZI
MQRLVRWLFSGARAQARDPWPLMWPTTFLGLKIIYFAIYEQGSLDRLGWEALCGQIVEGVWLMPQHIPELPPLIPPDTSTWCIGLELSGERMIVLYPEPSENETEPMALVIFRVYITPEDLRREDTELRRTMRSSGSQFGNSIAANIRVGDLLQHLVRSGMGFYRLKQRRGLRFWLCLVWFQWFHFMEHGHNGLPDIIESMNDTPIV